MKLKSIRLVNFGGYVDTTYQFFDEQGPKQLAVFCGPNGSGKTTAMEAIKIVSNPKIFNERSQSPGVYLRKMIRDDDYQPLGDAIMFKKKNEMMLEAYFYDDKGDYKVVLESSGFTFNDLPAQHGSFSYCGDADHPMNWNKFQLIQDQADKFIKLAEAVYGYPCDLDGEVTDTVTNPNTGEKIEKLYYNDVIINKNGTKVHFAIMSAGEKKLATFIRQLCNPDNLSTRDIVIIDNIELHIENERQGNFIDKLLELFPDKQFITTTHSIVLIGYESPKGKLEPHIDKRYLFNLKELKR